MKSFSIIAFFVVVFTIFFFVKKKHIRPLTAISSPNIIVKNINLNLAQRTYPIQNVSLGTVEDTHESDELNEYELNEFAEQVKNLSSVNKFNQNAFIPSTDDVNGVRDYFEVNESEENDD